MVKYTFSFYIVVYMALFLSFENTNQVLITLSVINRYIFYSSSMLVMFISMIGKGQMDPYNPFLHQTKKYKVFTLIVTFFLGISMASFLMSFVKVST